MDALREFGHRALLNLGVGLLVLAAVTAVYATSVGWPSRPGPPPTVTMQVKDR